MTAVATQPSRGVLSEVLARASDTEQWKRFERQLRSAGYCRHPVRLRGQVDGLDVETGEVRTIFTTAAISSSDRWKVLIRSGRSPSASR